MKKAAFIGAVIQRDDMRLIRGGGKTFYRDNCNCRNGYRSCYGCCWRSHQNDLPSLTQCRERCAQECDW